MTSDPYLLVDELMLFARGTWSLPSTIRQDLGKRQRFGVLAPKNVTL